MYSIQLKKEMIKIEMIFEFCFIVAQRKFHFWMKLHGTVLILLLVYSRVARWICWFRIAVWVDATDNELISFYTPVTLSLLVPSDWWIKNFRLNLFFQLVFLFILVSRKNVNLGKCFINICIIKNIFHLAPSCLL